MIEPRASNLLGKHSTPVYAPIPRVCSCDSQSWRHKHAQGAVLFAEETCGSLTRLTPFQTTCQPLLAHWAGDALPSALAVKSGSGGLYLRGCRLEDKALWTRQRDLCSPPTPCFTQYWDADPCAFDSVLLTGTWVIQHGLQVVPARSCQSC